MKFMTTLTVAALCAVSPWLSPAIAAPECVRFEGIDHCGIGEAKLKLAGNGSRLVASGLGEAGRDGVSSHFDSARLWNAELRIVNAQEGQFFRLDAVSEGVVASFANLKLAPNGLAVQTKFTGGDGSYVVEVLSGGKVMERHPGPDGGDLIVVPFPPSQPFPWPEPWPPESTFGQLVRGECFWNFGFDQRVEVLSSAGSLGVGDEVRLVERLEGSGHYPYAGFDSIHMLSNGPAIVITDETSISNGF